MTTPNQSVTIVINMKYYITIEDNNGDTVFEECTQLGEVAQKYLDAGRLLEKSGVTSQQIKNSIQYYCEKCGEPLKIGEGGFCQDCAGELREDHVWGEVLNDRAMEAREMAV